MRSHCLTIFLSRRYLTLLALSALPAMASSQIGQHSTAAPTGERAHPRTMESKPRLLARGVAKLKDLGDLEVSISSDGQVLAKLGEKSQIIASLGERTSQYILHGLAEIRRRSGSLEQANWEGPYVCLDSNGQRVEFPSKALPWAEVQLPIGDEESHLIDAAKFYSECKDPKRREAAVSYVEELANLTKGFIEVAKLFFSNPGSTHLPRGPFISTGTAPGGNELTFSPDGKVTGVYYDGAKERLMPDVVLTFRPEVLSALSQLGEKVANSVAKENYHPGEAKVCFNLGRPVKVSALGKNGWVVIGEKGCSEVVYSRRFGAEASAILSLVSSMVDALQ